MTAELPWTSVGVAKGYRGNSQVSTASATAHGTSTANATVVFTACAAVLSTASATAHGTSTANATVVFTACAAVLSVANSVVPTMATHGCPWQLPPQSSDSDTQYLTFPTILPQ